MEKQFTVSTEQSQYKQHKQQSWCVCRGLGVGGAGGGGGNILFIKSVI